LKKSEAGIRHRILRITVLLLVLLFLVILIAVGIGAVFVSPLDIFKALLQWGGAILKKPVPPKVISIIMFIRLPRVITAAIVGLSLAVAGASMQGLLRNPMASPDILGVSAGGSLGAVIAIHTGLFTLSMFMLPLMAILGSLLASALIFLIASNRGSTSLLFVIIAGMAVSSFLNGLISVVLLFSRQWEISQFIFWTMGGLGGRSWGHVLLVLPFLVPAITILFLFSRELNLFMLGEESAFATGLNVETVKRIILILSAVITGLSVSISGTIGFVGLLVPHFFRLLLGNDYRLLLPVSALGGASFLVLCDLIGRVIVPPFEIRVGIITSLLGAPYLITMILRYQKRGFIAFKV